MTPWTRTDARHVQARIAAAVITPHPPAELGDITLLPHQRDAVERIRAAMQAHHGALLADDVGLGKTYTALAVASAYEQIHVIAPAALQPMWQTAITHTHLRHVRLHSVHGFSRATPATPHPPAPTPQLREATPPTWKRRSTIVIIDEAHYLRTKRTARYAAVARFVSGCDTLLISATPIHNRADELRNVLGLFLGSRAARLSDTMLAQVVVRRTAATSHRTTDENHTTSARSPAVVRHPPQHMPHDRATLTHILELPAPLPAHDGAVAGALIRLGLLRAWCSSDAALAHALRQRQLRGYALLESLRAGRHPTSAELRSWLVGDHEVQLAFPELMAAHAVEAAPLIALLTAHLDGIDRLTHHHDRTAQGDSARADAIKDLMQRHPDTPIIAFSQFTHTIAALHRALSDIAGVGMLSSQQARIASGRISRGEALARFAPLAQERPPPRAHDAIRVLLSTDLLAEGVNLQDAGVVVHLDLPWTAALRAQRVGRCARIGSPHAVVHVYSFAPPPAGDRALRLQRRLSHKARLAKRYTGQHRIAGGRTKRSAASAASAVYALLQQWCQAPVHIPNRDTTEVAMLEAPHAAWIAHIAYRGTAHLLCGYATRANPRRRRVSTRSRALWRVMRSACAAIGVSQHASPSVPMRAPVARAVQRALADIRRWHAREHVRDDVGPARAVLSVCGRRTMLLIEQLVLACTPLERHALRRPINAAMHLVASVRGHGAEAALMRWHAQWAQGRGISVRGWLIAWQDEPLLVSAAASGEPRLAMSGHTAHQGPPLVVHALLLLGPDEPDEPEEPCR
jgi:superfamily II DNA or RNA helicase